MPTRDLWGGIVPPDLRPVTIEPSATEARSLPGKRQTRAQDKIDDEHFRDFSGIQYEFPPSTDAERNFRHSGWMHTRVLIQAALVRTQQGPARQQHFSECGSSCRVERSPSEKRIRIVSNHCHDRFCQPCQTARRSAIQQALQGLLKNQQTRFVTLTLKHAEMPLKQQLDRLFTCFRNLRASKLWKDHVDGGVAVLEVKRAKNGRQWHPHLHVLTHGRYLPQAALANAWYVVTGDSRVVDIRAVRDSAEAAGYVTKYLTKPLDHATTLNEDALDEAVLSLKGRRMFTTFGDWRGKELEPERPDPGDWCHVCTLDRLWAGRQNDEAWAIALWSQIHRVSFDEARNEKVDAEDTS